MDGMKKHYVRAAELSLLLVVTTAALIIELGRAAKYSWAWLKR